MTESAKDLREEAEPANADPAFAAELRRRVDRVLSGTTPPGDDYRVVLERLQRRHRERFGTSK